MDKSRFLPALAALAALPSLAMAAEPLAPKVLVITMFDGETKPWIEGRDLSTKVAVPGLSPSAPEVACDAAGLCVMTTTMGFANAASSTAAVALSDAFDLSGTYIVIAGIAGVDPKDGTTGGAYWARYAVDGGLRHDIDPRQVPEGWETGMVALGADAPGEKPKWSAGTEVFAPNPVLAEKAVALTKDVELADSDTAKAYRAGYDEPAARAAPTVGLCDTVSIDTYWHGSMMGDGIEAWARLMSDGAANYCTTQMEDNATLTALRRAADAGRLDFDRVALLRTASNFDREPHGRTPIESLTAESGGFGPATTNAYRVAGTLADAIIGGWDTWSNGVPAE